jgi:hypothetical protein
MKKNLWGMAAALAMLILLVLFISIDVEVKLNKPDVMCVPYNIKAFYTIEDASSWFATKEYIWLSEGEIIGVIAKRGKYLKIFKKNYGIFWILKP